MTDAEPIDALDEAPDTEKEIRARQAMRALWRPWLLVGLGLFIAAFPGVPLGLLASWLGAGVADYAAEFWAGMSMSGTGATRRVGLLLSLAGLVRIGYEWLVERYRVEGDIVSRSRGVVARSVDQLALQDIRTIGMDQSLIGRVLGYGTISLAAAGTGSDDVIFTRVKDPKALKDELTKRQQRRQ